MRQILVLLVVPVCLGLAMTGLNAGGNIVRVPDGVHCDTRACAEAFARAFARDEKTGWRLYAMELGRRKAALNLPSWLALAYLGFGRYESGFHIAEVGELKLESLKTKSGETYYKIRNLLSDDLSWYVVPTKTGPPPNLRRRRNAPIPDKTK